MQPRPQNLDELAYAPRKSVGTRRDDDPLRRLERLNAFVARIRPANCPPNPLKHGSWPVRKRVGRPEPR